jgi:hypothetical protein
MSCHNLSVNPHPKPDRRRLAQTTDLTLTAMIVLRESDLVSQHRLDLAGTPDVDALRAEARRRGLDEAAR